MEEDINNKTRRSPKMEDLGERTVQSENEALLSALIEASKEIFGKDDPRPDRDDPARYVWAYKFMNLYCFLPQSELEIFCSITETQLIASLQKNISDIEIAISNYGKKKYDDPFDEYEGRHDEQRDIFGAQIRAEEDVSRLHLLDELRIISVYRSIEIARNARITQVLPNLDAKRLHQVTYLRQHVPYWNDVFGLAQIEELRVINNCIKHSGVISQQLAGLDEQWKGQAGKRFGGTLGDKSLDGLQRPLKDAYERLAPYIGAYWNHFIEMTKLHNPEETYPDGELLTEEFLLELIRSGEDVEPTLNNGS